MERKRFKNKKTRERHAGRHRNPLYTISEESAEVAHEATIPSSSARNDRRPRPNSPNFNHATRGEGAAIGLEEDSYGTPSPPLRGSTNSVEEMKGNPVYGMKLPDMQLPRSRSSDSRRPQEQPLYAVSSVPLHELTDPNDRYNSLASTPPPLPSSTPPLPGEYGERVSVPIPLQRRNKRQEAASNSLHAVPSPPLRGSTDANGGYEDLSAIPSVRHSERQEAASNSLHAVPLPPRGFTYANGGYEDPSTISSVRHSERQEAASNSLHAVPLPPRGFTYANGGYEDPSTISSVRHSERQEAASNSLHAVPLPPRGFTYANGGYEDPSTISSVRHSERQEAASNSLHAVPLPPRGFTYANAGYAVPSNSVRRSTDARNKYEDPSKIFPVRRNKRQEAAASNVNAFRSDLSTGNLQAEAEMSQYDDAGRIERLSDIAKSSFLSDKNLEEIRAAEKKAKKKINRHKKAEKDRKKDSRSRSKSPSR